MGSSQDNITTCNLFRNLARSGSHIHCFTSTSKTMGFLVSYLAQEQTITSSSFVILKAFCGSTAYNTADCVTACQRTWAGMELIGQLTICCFFLLQVYSWDTCPSFWWGTFQNLGRSGGDAVLYVSRPPLAGTSWCHFAGKKRVINYS